MEVTAQSILGVLPYDWVNNSSLESIEKLDQIWYDYLKNNRYFWTDSNLLTKRGKEIKDNVIYLIEMARQRDWRYCLRNASVVGDSTMFNYVESKYLKRYGGKYTDIEDVNWFMKGAAHGGNLKYVKYFALKGGNDWDECMWYASYLGHYEVVEYCAKQGGIRWNNSAQNAARYGCINILCMAAYQKEIIDWDACMEMGASEGHMITVEYSESKGADNFNKCMKSVAERGRNLSLIEHLERKGADNFKECMSEAAFSGNFEFILHFQLKGADNFYECMQHSSWSGHLNYIKHFEKEIISQYYSIFATLPTCIVDLILSFEDIIDWDDIMISPITATERQWLEIIKYSEKKGANNWDQCLYNAIDRCDPRYEKILTYCTSRGGDASKAKPITEWDDYDIMEYREEKKKLMYEETMKYAKNKMIECGCY
uniref:Ankyrin repeat protein n=1 Tax=Pithovirus LCPAC401 TaxID=2506595 RepID=A0A481ZBX1_9VIRU|nr:MAG: hypothetical protein LCPAC401_02780 [Pithovirus LCPAC401]